MILVQTGSPEGYWGPPTSSIDWCESNYAVSHYVAEWFNALSSLAIVAIGVLGLYWHWRLLERRFLAVFASVVLVGVGSTAFHGTLLFRLQMLDELPMLYTATLMVYLLLERRATRVYGRWLPIALGAYLALTTLGASITRGQLQSLFFLVTFTALEFFGLYLTYRVYRQSGAHDQRRAFKVGIALYLAGILAWFLDFRFCDEVVATLSLVGLPNLQLHAVWHLLVACGLYCLVLVMAHERLRVLGKAPRIEGHWLKWRLSAGSKA